MERKYALSGSVLNGRIRVSYQSVLDIFIAQVTYVRVEWLENSDKQTEKEGKKKNNIYTLNRVPWGKPGCGGLWTSQKKGSSQSVQVVIIPWTAHLFLVSDDRDQEYRLGYLSMIWRVKAFGLVQSAMSLDGSGVKKVLLLMHHLLGVAVKREN